MQTLLNKRQRKPKGQYKRKYRETGNIGEKKSNNRKKQQSKRKDEQIFFKNTTQYVLDTTVHKQTQITLIRHDPSLQTTGGKDEPNIVVMRKSQRTSQHRSKNVNTQNRTKKRMSNTNPTKQSGVFAKGKQLLPLTRHAP